MTIQDSGGAVLLRLPDDTSVGIGRRVRVTGAMGTYYGAPQLTADSLQALGEGTATVVTVRSAPVPAALEWRLVTVSGVVESVHRDGDAWRAEIRVGSGTVPIVGIERSEITSTALEEGRTATVTGIVKRAFPTASDQRLTIVPRSTADVRLGGSVAPSSGGPTGADPSGDLSEPGSPGGEAPTPPTSSGSGSPLPGGAPAAQAVVRIADMAQHIGARVRIGGTVVVIGGARLTVRDDTGTAIVVLMDEAIEAGADLAPSDVINAAGTVERSDAGLQLVVSSPHDLSRLPAIGVASPVRTGEASIEPAFAGADASGAFTAAGSNPLPALMLAAMAAIGAAAIGTLALAGSRRRQALKTAFSGAVARMRI